MDRLRLDKRVAIVTGSNSGIGEATAILLAQRGARVTLHGRDDAKLQEAKKKIISLGAKSEDLWTVCGDITDQDVRQRLINETIQQFGQLDILVNNAGTFHSLFLRDITEKELDFHYNLLYKAPVMLCLAALPHLIKSKGNIVNVTSSVTSEPLPFLNVYSGQKSALENFTRAAAVEFGQLGIRLNNVLPGVIKTPIFKVGITGPGSETIIKQMLEGCAKKVLRGSIGESHEVAEVIAFVASDAASYVTGSDLYVDGGRHIYFQSNDTMYLPSYDDLMGKLTLNGQ